MNTILLIVLAVAQTLQLALKKNGNGNGNGARPAPATPANADADGVYREKVRALELEMDRIRAWRHKEYIDDQTRLAEVTMPRREIELRFAQQQEENGRLWSEMDGLRRKR